MSVTVTQSQQRVRANFQEILAPDWGIQSLHNAWNYSTLLAFLKHVYFQRTSWMHYLTLRHLVIQSTLQQTFIKSQPISRRSFSWACHHLHRNKRTHPGFSAPCEKQVSLPCFLQSAVWTLGFLFEWAKEKCVHCLAAFSLIVYFLLFCLFSSLLMYPTFSKCRAFLYIVSTTSNKTW